MSSGSNIIALTRDGNNLKFQVNNSDDTIIEDVIVNNEWLHVVVVVTKTQILSHEQTVSLAVRKIYINGILTDTVSLDEDEHPTAHPTKQSYSSNLLGDNFNGTIAYFRTWSDELTDTDVECLYSKRDDTEYHGETAVYDFRRTMSCAAVCAPNYIGLQHSWDFRGATGTIVVDSVSGVLKATYTNGSGSTGTVVSSDQGAVFTNGTYTGGSIGYINLDDFEIGGDTSFEAYVKITSTTSNGRVFGFGNGSEDDNILLSRYASNNAFKAHIYNDGTPTIQLDNVGTHTNNWVHLVLVCGDTVKLYQDGILIPGASATHDGIPTKTRTNHYLGKGNVTNDGGISGTMAFFRVYKGILSANDVSYIYDNRNYTGTESPINLNGLQMWFDAMNIDGNNNDSLTNGSNVTIWNDRRYFSAYSGATRHYAQNQSSNTHKFIIMGNGMPTVRFDKSTDGLAIKNRTDININGDYNTNCNVITTAGDDVAEYSIVAYVRRDNSTSNMYLAGNDTQNQKNLHLGWRSNTQFDGDHYGTQTNVITVDSYTGAEGFQNNLPKQLKENIFILMVLSMLIIMIIVP